MWYSDKNRKEFKKTIASLHTLCYSETKVIGNVTDTVTEKVPGNSSKSNILRKVPAAENADTEGGYIL